ncbi:MAG TPA: FtsQ-type POTRA domain-containing protein [Solirubrobacteraceae bacterium]|jgi:cell division protein FtsQ|nr:FtsQ-type POTRA domain-containing protein [Solirubrobacteraceae bacterium]
MDRSFAGRLGIGGVGSRPRSAGRPRRSTPAARRGTGAGVDRAIALVWRQPTALARLLAPCWALVRAHRRVRIALLVATLATPLLAGGWLWLRDSSLVAVRQVRIVGAHGADASAIDSALTQAARRMSTFDVKTGALRAAVAAYPIVGRIQAHASFPHSLSIRVIEQPPVASVAVAGVKTAVAADGVVLGPAHVSGSLPSLTGTTPLSTGEQIHNPTLLGALSALSAAPAPLASEVERAYEGPKGLTIVLHGGLLAYFGDATLAHAKWLSLARVLADASSAGASYVDVRVPERPAAGFPSGVAPPSSAGAEAERSTATPPSSESSQALAEGLSSAVGGSASGAPAASSGEHEETTSGAHEEASSARREATSSGEAEAGSGGESTPSVASESSGAGSTH